MIEGVTLQALWEGYGDVVSTRGPDGSAVVAKRVEPPTGMAGPSVALAMAKPMHAEPH